MKAISNVLELRVDNLVLNKHKEVHRFTFMDFMNFKHPSMGGNYGFYSIPLSEEWLVKLGFTKLWHMNKFQYAMYISESLNIEVQIIDERILLQLACTNDNNDLNIDTAYFTTMLEVKCDFVHSIQNLYFALTGQELTISE